MNLHGWVVVGESLGGTSCNSWGVSSWRCTSNQSEQNSNLTEGVEVEQLTVFKDYWRGNLDTNLENTELVSSKVFLEIRNNTGSQGGQ